MGRCDVRGRWDRSVLGAAAVALALLAGGCGLARTPAGGPAVALTVTRDFGHRSVTSADATRPDGSGTALGTLSGLAKVDVASGEIRSIAGLAAGSGRRWYQYVNGVQTTGNPADASIGPGDRVWWDLHASDAPGFPAAVVGAFPEPFRHGVGGKRLPVSLICAGDAETACRTVSAALSAAQVPFALQGLGTGSGPDTLAIVVGRFPELTGQIDAALLEKGPSASGVYARFAGRRYSTLELLDSVGRTVRRAGPGAGLVAAVRDKISEPTWLITGTDGAGVLAAARAIGTAQLRDRFAVAALPAGLIAVPIP